jgi:L-ascorbate metabolism protein UlaG (beta-lactamase superfamily)
MQSEADTTPQRPAQSATTWLGHGSLYFHAPSGTKLVIDPWLDGNPANPEGWDTIEAADAVLVTHGHWDHIKDVVSVARATGAQVIGTSEIISFFTSQGLKNVLEMNKSGTVEVAGLSVTMVHADHSSGCPGGEQQPDVEGGSPVGYVLRGSGFDPVYIAGDTGVFGDMTIIRDLYAPELAFLPIGGHFTMGPYEAAYACSLIGARRVAPYHWGTFPLLAGNPEQLRAELDKRGVECELVRVQPGEAVPLRGA